MTAAGNLAGPVVVVADGVAGREAVYWAAAEAAARGCGLRIVHPERGSRAAPARETAGGRARDPGTSHPGPHLEALAWARTVAGDLPVTAGPLRGRPVQTLLDTSADARLLVLPAGPRRPVVGSIGARVAARAACPVVRIGGGVRRRAASSAPRVVVGLGDATDAVALAFAFAAAAQRGIPLVVVHAWWPDRPADLEGVCGEQALTEALDRAATEETLTAVRSLYPAVQLVERFGCADAASMVLDASAGAALTVIGRGGRRPARPPGPVGRAVERHVDGPVAVVGSPPLAESRGLAAPGGAGDRRW